MLKKEEEFDEITLRNFAFIWIGIFSLIGIYPVFYGGDIRILAISISFLFLLVVFFKPVILQGFYKKWILFGNFIGRIISTIILFVLFFGLFTPISILLKVLRKDLLDKKIEKSVKSYWVDRDMQPQSMRKQF